MLHRRFVFVLILLVVGLLPRVAAADKTKAAYRNLSSTYRHWLDQEVTYIIESQERKEFLALSSDAERDHFMQQFWDARNPTPGSSENSYKEEHYRRLAYANEHFGTQEARDGWATDRGMTYITLGAPDSQATYPNSRNVRPIIIWFFQSKTPALPVHFYVLFYKRSASEDYTIYSPYQDGPNRLTTGLETLNDQARSLKQIRESLGDEVARTALCLIPTEPVDLNRYEPSLTSDALLSSIRGLADNPIQVEQIARNRRREKVTAAILTPVNVPEVGYTVLRDEQGEPTVQYLVRFMRPDAQIVGTRKDGTIGYDLTLRNHVSTTSGKPVYDTVTVFSGQLQPAQQEASRRKLFAVEDRLPLAPGNYLIESQLTNSLTLESHRFSKGVNVPAEETPELRISQPLAYKAPAVRTDQMLPFVFSGVRFNPKAIGTVELHAGDPLSCVFQLWLPRTKTSAVSTEPIDMHYFYGSVALGGKPLAEADERVEPADADRSGNLVTGHVFSTSGLMPGSYRVIVRAVQGNHAPVYASMTLKIIPTNLPVGTWTVYGPPEPQDDASKRSLSESMSRLERSSTKGPSSTQ